MRKAKGIALVAVLWGVLLLAVLAAGIAAITRVEGRLAFMGAAHAEEETLFDSALIDTVQRMVDGQPTRHLPVDGTSHTFHWRDRSAEVSITMESGRIDLNAASDELLVVLGQTAGLTHEGAESWVAKLRDWQDVDQGRRLKGANGADYKAAGRSYGPRNGPMKSVDELTLLLGMSDREYQCIAPAVTVYTRSRDPEVSRLVPAARRAWELLQKTTSGSSVVPTAQQQVATIEASGQVLRVEIRDVTKGEPDSRLVVVGRLVGGTERPWITLARWVEAPASPCITPSRDS